MSWSIETPVQGNEDMENLKKAVDAAAAREILMFCSTNDQGSSTKDFCYPGDFDSCIKIGGATETGEALSWVNTEKIHFLLPGKDWPFHNNENKIISHESGSSVATAAASGLAGLFLWCSRLVHNNRYLQYKRGVRVAFDHLVSKNKFVQVQWYFEDHFKKLIADLEKPKKDKDSKQTLKQIMSGYDISTMEWTDNCQKILEGMMGEIFEAFGSRPR